MLCALTGQVPTDPVVSSKSGHLFERSTIERHLSVEGKCPITGEPLSLSDLIAVKVNPTAKPRPTSAASVPQVLTLLQDEWDAVMLETYTLRKHLDEVRQELSQALYQHDAACRVIARLVRERDAALAQLATVQNGSGRGAGAATAAPAAGAAGAAAAAPQDEPMVDGGAAAAGLPASVMQVLQDTWTSLSTQRRGRKKAASYPEVESVVKFAVSGKATPHSASKPGILALAVSPRDENVVLTGGADASTVLYNRASNSVTAKIQAHSKKVTGVAFHPTEDAFFSCSFDHSVRVYKPADDSYAQAGVWTPHTTDIFSLSVHPCGQYVASAGADHQWVISDVATAAAVFSARTSSDIHRLAFHPDGLVLATGDGQGMATIWELANPSKPAAAFNLGAPVQALAFSENGYHFATATQEGKVQLWDLRYRTAIGQSEVQASVNALAFDYTGQWLAFGADDVRVMHSKKWKHLATLPGTNARVTDLAFGRSGTSIIASTLDGLLQFYS